MNIIDYDIIKSDDRLLIFVSVEDFPREDTKLKYKTIHNMIYPVSGGYCVADKKGVGLAIRPTLEDCVTFLNSELGLKYNLKADLDLDKVQEIKN